MLTLIVLLVLVIVSFLCVKPLYKKTWEMTSGFVFVTGCVFSLALIVSCCSLINKQAEFASIKEKCMNVQSIVQAYDNTDKDRIEALGLMQLVYETNNTISTHKVYSKSPWSNLWYSKEIGNLPKIELKTVHDE